MRNKYEIAWKAFQTSALNYKPQHEVEVLGRYLTEAFKAAIDAVTADGEELEPHCGNYEISENEKPHRSEDL